MRRLALALLGLLMMQAPARADEVPLDPQARVEQEAKRVWSAFGDGVAPEPEIGREARRVLEAFVDALPAAKRSTARLHTDSADVLLAKAAWAAGDHATATKRAEAVLVALRAAPKDWDSGNILHEMHILLGRVALETGNLDEADRQLLNAARTPGSPQLDTFGPDWTLARDLLERGHREAVAVYVLRVGAFWESGRDDLAEGKKTLAAGGTPKFFPKRRAARKESTPEARKAFGEPPALATPSDGVVGFWESTAKSQGGIGHVLEFRPGGAVRSHIVILVDGKYRIDGEQMFVDTGEKATVTPWPLGSIEGDTWKSGAVEKKRVGAATPAAHAIVGIWTYDGLGGKVFERYDKDGWMRFRMFMAGGPTSGTYEKRGDSLRLTFQGEPEDGTLTITEDRLRLVSDGKERNYRYVGARPWYMPSAPAKKD